MLQRFLDPATLASIAGLDLVAKTVVDGFVAGLHRSPDFGFSQEFAEYRAYGLLLNFNEPMLKNGIKRLVNHFRESAEAPIPSAPSAIEPDARREPTTRQGLSKSQRLSVSAVK